MKTQLSTLGYAGIIFSMMSKVTLSLVLAFYFVINVAIGAVVHLDLPITKTAVARLLERTLNETLRGSFHVGSISSLTESGVEITNVDIKDPDGRSVLRIQRFKANISPLSIAKRLLDNHEKLSIEVSEVRTEGFEVFLLQTRELDTNGEEQSHLSLSDAFETLNKSKGSSSSSRRQVRVWFPQVDLLDVYARGAIAGSPTFEARVPHARASVLVTEKGAAIDVERFGISTSGLTEVDTVAHGEVHVRVPGALWGTVAGKVGQVPFHQEFRFEEEVIEIRGDLPELRPTFLEPLTGSWPIDQALSVQNHISGNFQELDIRATVQGKEHDGLWPGSLEVHGKLHLSPKITAHLDLATHSLDLSSLDSGLPASDLDSESTLVISAGEKGPLVSFTTRIQPGLVAGKAIPSIVLSGSSQGNSFSMSGALKEEGLNANFLLSKEAMKSLHFELSLPRTEIDSSPRLRELTRKGSGILHAEVSGTVDDQAVHTSANLSVSNFASLGVSISQAEINTTSTSPLDEPLNTTGSAEFRAKGLRSGSVRVKELIFAAKGPLLSPDLKLNALTEQGLVLKASSKAQAEPLGLSDFKAELSGSGKPVHAEAKTISLGDSHLIVSNFFFKSHGEVKGDIDLHSGGGKVAFEARGLNVSRLGKALGYASSDLGGMLNADIALEVGRGADGYVEIELQNGSLGGVTKIELDTQCKFQGSDAEGSFNASVQDLGKMSGSWQGRLPGSLLDPNTYKKASGAFRLALKDIELPMLSLLAQGSKFPRSEGLLNLSLEAQRDHDSQFPALSLTVTTRDLKVEVQEQKLEGINIDLAASVPAGGDRLETALHLKDRLGALVSISGEIGIPVDEWADFFSASGEAWDQLQKAPLNLVAVVPRREISTWPGIIPRPVEEGYLSGRIVVDGNLRSPRVGLLLIGDELAGGDTHFSEALDLKLNGHYRADSGSLRGSLSVERGAHRLGSTHFELLVPFTHLFTSPPAHLPFWTGSAQVLLESTPLELLDVLKDARLRGQAQGSINIHRTQLLPRLSGELQLQNLAVDQQSLGDALVHVTTHGHDLVTRSEFRDEYGTLRATAELGIDGTSLGFRPADDRPVFFTLQSEQYNAAVLTPLVSDAFEEFSGNLNGQLRGEFIPPRPDNPQWSSNFSGEMELKNATFTPTALGLRLHSAGLKLKASREGDWNVIRLSHFRAKAESKKHNLKGSAEFYFRDFDLKRGNFRLVPSRVPFLLDGIKMADLTGETKGRFSIEEEGMTLDMTIDNLTADLAESAESNLISLDENPNIEVLQMQLQETAKISQDNIALNIAFHLGENVRIKNSTLDIRIKGNPQIRLKNEVELRGEIKFVQGGRFQIMGRGFTLAPGALTFDTGDSNNPHINASATWTAPSGVVVRGTLRGTLKAPTLEWTSEPALPGGEAAVFALVLGAGGNANQNSVGISSLALVANEALGASGVRGVEIYMTQEEGGGEGRMASLTESNWDSYTAAIRLNDELWFEGSLQKGSTGFQSDERRGVSGTLDWRFHPQWSARTELGTLGAGLDLLWRYRY